MPECQRFWPMRAFDCVLGMDLAAVCSAGWA